MKNQFDKFSKSERRSFINSIRGKFPTIQDAHNHYFNTSQHDCDCGKPLQFISFFDGYRDKCKECYSNRYKDVRDATLQERNRTFTVEKFLEYYNENKNEFHDILDNKELNQYFKFFDRETGSYTKLGYLQKYFGKKHFELENECSVCKKKSKYTIFEKDFKCKSHKCRNSENINKQREIRETKIKDKHSSRDIKFDYVCKLTGIEFNIPPKSPKFTKHLISNDISFDEYMDRFEGTKRRFCSYCNKKLEFITSHPIIPYGTKQDKKYMFCSHSHYVEFRRENTLSDIQVETPDSRKARSDMMKSKIASGEFTPARNNYNRLGLLKYNNISYRSRWEIVFHIDNPTFLYEKIRIPYTDENGSVRNYIIDFVDEENGILYEIKPESKLLDENTLAKEKAAKEYAKNNNLKYKFITDTDIIKILQKTEYKDAFLCKFKNTMLNQLKLNQ